MKVLVTGGAGFIGSHSVDLLLSLGYEVRVLDALQPPVHPGGKIPDYLPDEVEVVVGDVRDEDIMTKSLRGVDLVLHLAAYQDYLTDFSTFFHTNSVGTALLYELIVRNKFPVERVVVASSQAVYGEGRYLCKEHGPQYPNARPVEQLLRGEWDLSCPECGATLSSTPTDESVVNPHNSYAISKHSQEMISLKLGRRYEIPTVALRYSITQGPRQSFHNAYSGILRIFSLSLLRSEPPIIYEDGQQLRDYVFVEDVARANLLALTDRRCEYQVFNVGGLRGTTVLEYAQAISDVTDSDIELQASSEFRLGDTRHVVSDISKLKQLGWSPSKSPREIASIYVDWVRQQPGISDSVERALDVMRRTGVVQKAVGTFG